MNTFEKLEPTKIRYPILVTGITNPETAIDIHPHTSFSDGKLTLEEAFKEAYNNRVYEKGSIEHGNPLDEDIDHPTTFMGASKSEDESYTSSGTYPVKFENIQAIAEDLEGAITLTEGNREKLREDLELLDTIYTERPSANELKNRSLNYRMAAPHGIELDYNIPIEDSEKTGEIREVVESYENEIIEFLKDAERRGAGFNYVLLSSHYVNTPYRPRYVKRDELFAEMSHDEKLEVLEAYRDKEVEKIESLSSKLGEMAVPEISGELMTEDEMNEIEDFIYDQSGIVEDYVEGEIDGSTLVEISGQPLNLDNTVIAVGAHPTLIERNSELMDAFRREEGLGTTDEIVEELNSFYYDITHLFDEIPEGSDTVQFSEKLGKSDLNQFIDEYHRERLYPREALKSYYMPMIEASENEDNFIFEINGKGLERQHPSIFWDMLDEYTFGSDSHRPGEQPSRSEEFSEKDFPGELSFLSEKWLNQLEDKNNRLK